MINNNSKIANQFLNDLGNFKNDIKPFNNISVQDVNDTVVILKNGETGKSSNYSKYDLAESIAFRLDIGIFNEQAVTKENAQSKFSELCTLLV